jgi:formamidopyrimidine-DNA glycosylase
MPELPEVETSRRGIEPWLVGERIESVEIRERRLRWPVSREVEKHLTGVTVTGVKRRAKYLLLETPRGSAIIHLGMSGSVYIVDRGTPAGIHEHFDLKLGSGRALRYRDPRRFGSLHWTSDVAGHWLLKDLGPEPLGPDFNGRHLWERSRGRKVAVKPFIMNASIVVGVGNIYASEALFIAGIHPRRAAGRIALQRYEKLADAIRWVLDKAIAAGGTTLRDFYGGDGEAGYFRHELTVYDRADEPCLRCGEAIRSIVLGQRATYYCKHCQK